MDKCVVLCLVATATAGGAGGDRGRSARIFDRRLTLPPCIVIVICVHSIFYYRGICLPQSPLVWPRHWNQKDFLN